jgi:hypothetical protein
MGSDRSTSLAVDQTGATSQIAGIRSACYVNQSSVTDVLLEQLRYLIGHKSLDCPADCVACERLSGAQSWLLLPFRATATQGSTPPESLSVAEAVSKAIL